MSSGPGRLIGNLIALIGVALAIVILADQAAVWMGFRPWFVCSAYPVVQSLSNAAGLVLASVGFVAWAFTAFKSTPALLLFLGGLAVGVAPQILGHYLGATCA